MASLGAALGGEGTADRLPGRSLPTLVLGRLGYPAGAGAPRLRALLGTTVPSGIDDSYNGYEYDARPRAERNAPALNALWDEYLWQLLRAWISVRGPQVGTSARHVVASTPELSRQVVAFLVGDPSIHA